MSWTEPYRHRLTLEFKRKKEANPKYSLRAFARTLGASPSFVSDLLAGERNPSLERAEQLLVRLGYSKPEVDSLFRSFFAKLERTEFLNPNSNHTRFLVAKIFSGNDLAPADLYPEVEGIHPMIRPSNSNPDFIGLQVNWESAQVTYRTTTAYHDDRGTRRRLDTESPRKHRRHAQWRPRTKSHRQ